MGTPKKREIKRLLNGSLLQTSSMLCIPVTVLALVLSFACLSSAGQDQSQRSVPVYRITVVGRTVQAINYRSLSGSTKIDFRGTSLMPNAKGNAKVTSKLSATRIQASFKNLEAPSAFGPEYLTYVLWAITPDGRAANVAEIVPSNGQAQLDVTVNLQAFGLIVTAEPYFAVHVPSDVVVMENQVTNQTVGKIEKINAKVELLRKGQYTENANPSQVHPVMMSPKTPLALYEAENAIDIARWTGADHYAADTFNKAQQLLQQAQNYQARKAGKKPVIMTAREAVQTAEDARTISVRRQNQEHQAQERQLAAERTASANAQAAQESAARTQAEAAQNAAQAAQAKAQAEAERSRFEAQQARANAQQSAQQAQQADAQRAQMRAKLLQQLNAILQTRQTPRGLVVTMSQVLFNTGKYTLQPDTRVMLAKLAGVLLTYPGLKIEVDGYTDTTGSEATNDKLSQQRADAVRDFLVQQGVASDSISSRGLGESNPVAPNDTATGRGLNRRVEIVISGNAIGIAVTPSAQNGPARQTAPPNPTAPTSPGGNPQ
ncbi:MAG: OmpA family protein [Terriglobia bacterium]